MMKAVLTNRIYMTADQGQIEEIREVLTHTIPPMRPNAPTEVICDVTSIGRNIVSIPIGRSDLIPKYYHIVDKRANVPAKIPDISVKLRKSQEEIVSQVDDSCLINAKPGWGKTFVALSVASKLQQKTLIIVHTVALRDQWVEECKKLNIPYGIIGSGKFNIDHPITISNVQTLSRKITGLESTFGLVIVDECHHIPASSFKNIIDKSKARYKIGLSATLQRKDKKHIMLPDYIGGKVYVPDDKYEMIPEIHTFKSNIKLNSAINIPWATKINQLKEDPEYRDLVIGIVRAYQELSRKILVVSDRVDFLRFCAEEVENSICIVGTTKERKKLIQSVYTDDISTIFGSISIFKEGLSINVLDCLILGTPVNNNPLLEQLIGRITRKHEGKETPIVADIILKGYTARNQANSRMNYYINKGYKIRNIL